MLRQDELVGFTGWLQGYLSFAWKKPLFLGHRVITKDKESEMTATIDQALAALARGEMLVVVDSEDRENEGDLILAAEHATPQRLAFMVRHSSGVICVGLPGERLDALHLPLMVAQNSDAMGTAYTVTVDYRHGTSTGISASDRAATLRALVDPQSDPSDFSRPGHVFPLRAREGGVLVRPGHTEASVDLTRLAGLRPGGVLVEIVNDDGSMARRPQLEQFAQEHGLLMVTIADLISWRKRNEVIVEKVSSCRLPTKYGVFTLLGYRELADGQEHLALVMGDPGAGPTPLVRVHSECLTGEVLGSLRCDCASQLTRAMSLVAAEGYGVIVYLRGHEGRGIGLLNKLRAYALQDGGADTVQANIVLGFAADQRDYAVGAQILRHIGVSRMRLMTNNPLKYEALSDFGLEIEERVSLVTSVHRDNIGYLAAKQRLFGHTLGIDGCNCADCEPGVYSSPTASHLGLSHGPSPCGQASIRSTSRTA
jgi:3,4-dihydroxy 2-butanone 4-phosphate synthase/GTP cyclohydrolase II